MAVVVLQGECFVFLFLIQICLWYFFMFCFLIFHFFLHVFLYFSLSLFLFSIIISARKQNRKHQVMLSRGCVRNPSHPAGNVSGWTLIDFLALPAHSEISVLYHGPKETQGFLSLRKLWQEIWTLMEEQWNNNKKQNKKLCNKCTSNEEKI